VNIFHFSGGDVNIAAPNAAQTMLAWRKENTSSAWREGDER